MHALQTAAVTLLVCVHFQAHRGSAVEVYVPKVPVKVAVKWKDWEKDGGDAAVKLAYKAIYAAALKCIGTKIEKQLMQLACHLWWSSASVIPSIPGLIAKIGMDYARCMPKAIGMQMAGAFGKMITVTDNTAKLEDWGFSHVKQFIAGIGKEMPAVSRVPNIQKLPWLAPLLRFVWNLELNSEKDEPTPDVAEKAMEVAVRETEKKSPEMSEKERKTWLKSFSLLGTDAINNVAGKLAYPGLSLADFVLYSWYGMAYAEVKLCNWNWAVMLNSAQTWAGMTSGLSAAADTAFYLLPKRFTKASAKLTDMAQKQKDERDKLQADLKSRGMTQSYWDYLQRMIASGLATDLKPAKPSDPIAELIDAAAAKMLSQLAQFAAKPAVTSLVLRTIQWDRYYWMESYESPTDKDIGRAVDSAASYCWRDDLDGAFGQADMYALMCENAEHMSSLTRQNEITLIRAAMDDKEASENDAVSNFVKANVINERMATAAIGKMQTTMEKFFSGKETGLADHKLIRYLMTKGLLFYQCVQLQTVHLIYDEGRLEKYKKITAKARLHDIKKWKDGGGLLRRTIKEVCRTDFVEFNWEKGNSKTAINWANLKDKSEIARFLGLVLLGRPSSTEPTAKDIPCLDYADDKKLCHH